METVICPFEIEAGWKKVLDKELYEAYMLHLAAFLETERAGNTPIYPPKELVFNAFNLTSFEKVKVVIVGQDPYHGARQAHGLSFSVPIGVPPPPSLKNIFKELVEDVGITMPAHGCLISWAKQGVMLINATLTVREGVPMSHHGRGWERFTDAVIAKLCERVDPVIFVLWGNSAKEKMAHIAQAEGKTPHYVLSAPHPSPFSAHSGFFGCRHFSKTNELLKNLGKDPINWSLT